MSKCNKISFSLNKTPFCIYTPFYNICKKFLRTDWLMSDKSTVNKNNITCNEQAFSMENKGNSARTFSVLLYKKWMAVFYGPYS